VEVKLESNYDSTRLDASLQQTLNLYRHSARGYRQVPGLVELASFTSGTSALEDSTLTQITDSLGATINVVSQPGGDDRGTAEGPLGRLYAVSGESLYAVSANGSATFIGTIGGTTPVVMAYDGDTELVITAGPDKYSYTTAGGLVAITDVDLGNAYTCAYLDSRFVFDQPNGQFAVSALNDGTSIAALDFAEAEAFGDSLLRVFSLNQMLYLFGEKSTEIWYTSGVGRPPLDRQAVRTHGICGRYACDDIDDQLYFIDHNRRPMLFLGQQHQNLIQANAIGEEWQSYDQSNFDLARVNAYSLQQENFVDFTFPEVGKTWTFHEASGEWLEKSFGPTSLVRIYNKTIAAHATNAKMYTLDFTSNDDVSGAMTRRKYLPLITGELFQHPGKNLIAHGLRLHVQTSGSASITAYISKDLSSFTSLGAKTVNGNTTVEWQALGEFREAVLYVETATDVKVDILDAAMDMEALDN